MWHTGLTCGLGVSAEKWEISASLWVFVASEDAIRLLFNFPDQDIGGAMKLACEILTADPEGGAARIPFNLFQFIYKYLAEIDGDISQDHVNAVLECLEQQVWVALEVTLLHVVYRYVF